MEVIVGVCFLGGAVTIFKVFKGLECFADFSMFLDMFLAFESCWRLFKVLWSLDLLRFVFCFVFSVWLLVCCF